MTYGAVLSTSWLALGVCALAISGCSGDDGSTDDTMASSVSMTSAGTAGSDSVDDGSGTDDMGDDGMDSSSGGDDGGPVPTHAADIQPIWDAYCVDACHVVGGEWPTNDLSDSAYDRIVEVPSGQNSLMNFIEPGDPDASYLWHKIQGTQIANGGSGLNMPKAIGDMEVAVVPQADLDTIEAWIAGGAPP